MGRVQAWCRRALSGDLSHPDSIVGDGGRRPWTLLAAVVAFSISLALTNAVEAGYPCVTPASVLQDVDREERYAGEDMTSDYYNFDPAEETIPVTGYLLHIDVKESERSEPPFPDEYWCRLFYFEATPKNPKLRVRCVFMIREDNLMVWSSRRLRGGSPFRYAAGSSRQLSGLRKQLRDKALNTYQKVPSNARAEGGGYIGYWGALSDAPGEPTHFSNDGGTRLIASSDYKNNDWSFVVVTSQGNAGKISLGRVMEIPPSIRPLISPAQKTYRNDVKSMLSLLLDAAPAGESECMKDEIRPRVEWRWGHRRRCWLRRLRR